MAVPQNVKHDITICPSNETPSYMDKRNENILEINILMLLNVSLKVRRAGVPVVAQWLTNPTRNHEVAGLVPGLAQWVRDLSLP